ncbi:MAG TPA: YdcF family protein [Candidatus Binatus sp.]|jgi:uncharacterized SAM-binding protein YcdF (DUF218 family)|nr:YdcF family protein [Candidatus Binatus sp.]
MEGIEKPRRDGKRNPSFFLAFLLLALIVLGIIAFRGVGRWLVREDPPARADAIVVLSGGLPYRAEEAAKYFASGYGSEVWITRPDGPAEQLKEVGISFIGEDEYSRQVLIHRQVPESDVLILPGTIVNTQQEVEEIVRELHKENKVSVMIVTSPQHTRRVKALWNKMADKNLSAIVRAAPDDPYDADHWWRNTRDALSVVREILGLLNVWAGLPVHPHTD